MTFETPWVLNEEESLPLLEHAYTKGIRTWDTVSRVEDREKCRRGARVECALTRLLSPGLLYASPHASTIQTSKQASKH